MSLSPEKLDKYLAQFVNKDVKSKAIILIYIYFGSKYIRQYFKKVNDEIKYEEHKITIQTIDDLLGSYFPTEIDQAIIALSIMYQTGWNKETVLALDRNNYEHPLNKSLFKNNPMIISEKQRGQGNNLPYYKPKQIFAFSDKDDRYSAINGVRLALDLSFPLAGLPRESIVIKQHETYNEMFLCIRKKKGWTNAGGGSPRKTGKIANKIPGRFTSISRFAMWKRGIKSFFSEYEIFENGKRLTSADDIKGRLRPTWFLKNKQNKNIALQILSNLQNHSTVETTDIYYDSSGPAMKERRKRLRSELEAVMKLLQEKKFKGILPTGRENVAPQLPFLRIFTIPGHNSPLWGCVDPYEPDWKGSTTIINNGSRCNAVHKCLFCSKVRILEESLPFLMERRSIVENLINQQERVNNYLSEELEIIEYILDNWGDEDALKKAARYHRRNKILLPNDMMSLTVLFED